MHLKVILLVRDMPKLWRPSLKKRLKRACDCCLSYFGAKPMCADGRLRTFLTSGLFHDFRITG